MKNEIERLKKANPNQTAKDRFKLAALNVSLTLSSSLLLIIINLVFM